jgi:hypothetical protein
VDATVEGHWAADTLVLGMSDKDMDKDLLLAAEVADWACELSLFRTTMIATTMVARCRV